MKRRWKIAAVIALALSCAMPVVMSIQAAEAAKTEAPAGGGESAMAGMPEGVVAQLIAGGPIAWLLCVESVVVLGMAIELYVISKIEENIPNDVLGDIEASLDNGQYEEALDICNGDKSMLGRVIGAGLAKMANGLDRMQAAMYEESQNVMTPLDFKLGWLSTLASLGPSLGLLGTVVGMIEAFGVIAKSTTTNPQMLAGGIYVALVCTTVGLVVFIPGTACFVFLRVRLLRHKMMLATISEEILDRFRVTES